MNVLADMSDLMKNFSSIMNGKEIPDNIKEMLNSFSNKSNNSASNTADGSSNNTTKNVANNSSDNTNNKDQSNSSHFDTQESCQRTSNNSFNNSSNNCAENSSPFDGIDFDTMMKMQKIISSMNSSSNSSGANLLRSLKPYLKPSRQAKVDECIQLLSLEKAFSLMNNSNISNRW